MADMKVAMTLTVKDLGTVKLQRFNDVLKSMGDQVSALNDRFKAALGGASDFGKALSDASAGIGRFGKAAADMGQVTTRASGSLGALSKTLLQAEADTSALFQSSMVMNKEALKSAFTFEKAAGAAAEYDASMTPLGATLSRVAEETQAAIVSTLEMNRAQLKSLFTFEKAEVAATEYSASVTRIGETLQAVAAQTQEMIASTMVMDKSMLSAAFAATGLGDKSLIAAGKMNKMGDAVEGADAKLGHMHGTMKGLVELFAAFKMGEGLHKSVEVASSYQQERIQMRLMGIPGTARHQMLQQASQLQNIPGVSKLSALEAALGGYAAVPGAGAGQTQIRQALMPEALKAAMVLKTSFHDQTPLGTIVRNILGSVEMTGHLENIPQALQGIREVLQIAEGSHGKITPINLETALRNTAYGESLRYSKQGLFTVEALHEQFKAAGGAGGSGGNTKAATIAGMVAAMQMGGRMQKIQALMLENLGLLKPQDVLKIRGTSTAYVKPGILPHSAEGLRNPIQWVHDVLDPHIAALIHKQNPGLSGAAFNSRVMDWGAAYAKASGGGNVGTGIVLTMQPEQWARLKNTRKQMEMAATPGQGLGELQHSAQFKWNNMLAKWETVGVQIGTALLPALTSLAHWITVVAQAITSLNTHWPIFKSIEAWAGALAALLLGIKGVEWLMGIKDAFSAIKGVQLAGTLVTWAAKATLGEEAVAGLASGLGGLGAVIAGLAGPITLAIAAIAAFGYAAYSMRHQLESGWAEFKHYLHPHAFPLHKAIPLGLTANATHWGGAPNRSLDTEKAHMAAMTAMAAHTPGLGYTGPVTAAGLQKAAQEAAKAHGVAMKHANAIANAHQKAIDHLFAIADKAAAKATAVAAKMNAAAVKLHLAFMAMTNPLGAKIAGVNLKYGGIATEMTKAGHPGAAADALAIGHHKVLQYQYQGAMQHLSALKGNLHQTLTNTAALVTTGSLTKMQAAQQTIQEQKAAAPAMIQAADAAIKYAKALGDPKLVQALQIQRTHLQAMGQQLGYYAAKVKNTTQHAMTGLFENMMHGQKTWGQMFGSFFASIGKSLENTLAQAISQAIAKSLFTKKTGGAINSIFSLLGSAFSGGSSGSSSSPFAGAAIGAPFQSSGGGSSIVSGITAGGTFLKDLFSVIGSFAVGADNIPNDMVAQIHKGEMIIPAGPAEAIRSGASAGHTLNLTVHAMDSQSVMGALHSVRAEATQLFMNTASHLNYNGG